MKETAKEPSQPPPQEDLHKPSELDMMGLLVLPEDKVKDWATNMVLP